MWMIQVFAFWTLLLTMMAPPSMGFSRQEYWSGVPLPWVNLTQMTIISTTVGRNPLEEME